MPETLIKVENVSKKFCTDLKRGLWYGVKDLGLEITGMKAKNDELREKEFWAVKDVSFEVRRGECLGLIGRNGAGKSTLLKMLNGLIKPDRGKIEMKGRVGALIELSAGFNPILTGRENIYINGSILGFSKAEINRKLSAILDFAGINDFIDTPVQYYSSGMKVRLGFAVAAQMEPDVLLIDEVLAVGDLGFVLKCLNTIDELMEKSAVIFVSHSMPMVSRVGTGILLLENGAAKYCGNNVSFGIDQYYEGFVEKRNNKIDFDRGGDAELIAFEFGNTSGNSQNSFSINRLEDVEINIKTKVKKEVGIPCLAVSVFDKEQRPVAICVNENEMGEKNIYHRENGYVYYHTKLIIPRINLSKGIYSFSFSISETFQSKPILRLRSVCEFQVVSKNDVWPPVEFEGKWT